MHQENGSSQSLAELNLLPTTQANSKHWFTTSFLPSRKVPESDARSVPHRVTTGRRTDGKSFVPVSFLCTAYIIVYVINVDVTAVCRVHPCGETKDTDIKHAFWWELRAIQGTLIFQAGAVYRSDCGFVCFTGCRKVSLYNFCLQGSLNVILFVAALFLFESTECMNSESELTTIRFPLAVDSMGTIYHLGLCLSVSVCQTKKDTCPHSPLPTAVKCVCVRARAHARVQLSLH